MTLFDPMALIDPTVPIRLNTSRIAQPLTSQKLLSCQLSTFGRKILYKNLDKNMKKIQINVLQSIGDTGCKLTLLRYFLNDVQFLFLSPFTRCTRCMPKRAIKILLYEHIAYA